MSFFFSTHKQDKRKVTCRFERCTFNVKETKKMREEKKQIEEVFIYIGLFKNDDHIIVFC
jgi:hypothetical protein